MKNAKIKIGILFFLIVFLSIKSLSLAISQINTTDSIQIQENNVLEDIVDMNKEEETTIELINKYREESGLNKLQIDGELQKIARKKAEDIVKNQYFSHTSPTLGTPFELIKNEGIQYNIAGENLAGNSNPIKAVNAWISSQSHRENILESRFLYTGICVIESPVYGQVFVQIFIG